MNLEQVYDALQKIAGVSSKTEKEKLVEFYLSDETFAKVCFYAYNPFYHYGVVPDLRQPTTAAQISGTAKTPFPQSFFDILDWLRTREIKGADARKLVDDAIREWHIPVADLLIFILRKDLRAGFTDGTLNRVRKGFVPSFDCMLAHKYEEKRIKSWPVAVQPKLDGVRCLVRYDLQSGDIRFFSRTGKEEFAKFPLIEQDLILCGKPSSPGIIWIDGELTSGNFNKTVGDVRRKSAVIEDVVLTVFEWLYEYDFQNGSPDGHVSRRNWLLANVPDDLDFVKPIDEWEAHSHEQIMLQYQTVRDQGGEGVIVKPLNGRYEPKRSHAWLKIKDQQTLDLRCIGTFEGEGKYAGMIGGFIVDHKGTAVKVGSGLSDELRRKSPDEFIDQILEVEFHEVTPDNSLRHPRFNGVRFDKTQPDA
jgi:ATP-dependent DNA ligase